MRAQKELPKILPNLENRKVIRLSERVTGVNNSLSRWVREHARLGPARLVLITPEKRITYAELEERVNRTAAVLAGLGLVKGDRVALYMLNCAEWFELVTAGARLGLILVPLNVRLTPPELQYQLMDSGCTAIACGEEFWPVLPQLLGGTSVTRVLALHAPGSESLLLSLPGARSIPYEEALASAGTAPQPDVAAESDPLLIVYTSGTTGKPKGAVLTHGNMLFNAMNNCIGLGLTAEDITLTVLPLFHVGGIGLFSLPAIYAGATIALPRRFDPAEALRWIERERVTVTMTVPTIMQAYLDALDQMEPGPDLSSCRGFISGGAPCPAELTAAVAARGLSYGQGYGMTETAPTVFLQPEMRHMRQLPPGRHIGRPGTIGKAVLFTEVRLLDDAGDPVPAGEVGEICIKGGNLFAGYWQMEEATASSFTTDGFFRSGDLARMDEDGYVTIMGRRKEMLISGGENIYPLEVEQVLQSHPAVAESAVVGVPDARWGEIPGAGVVLRPGAQVTAEELTTYCRSRLAGYKTPKRWLFLPALPRTAIGKVIKPQLVQMIQEGNR